MKPLNGRAQIRDMWKYYVWQCEWTMVILGRMIYSGAESTQVNSVGVRCKALMMAPHCQKQIAHWCRMALVACEHLNEWICFMCNVCGCLMVLMLPTMQQSKAMTAIKLTHSADFANWNSIADDFACILKLFLSFVWFGRRDGNRFCLRTQLLNVTARLSSRLVE